MEKSVILLENVRLNNDLIDVNKTASLAEQRSWFAQQVSLTLDALMVRSWFCQQVELLEAQKNCLTDLVESTQRSILKSGRTLLTRVEARSLHLEKIGDQKERDVDLLQEQLDSEVRKGITIIRNEFMVLSVANPERPG